MITFTTSEVAEQLRVTARTVRRQAATLGLGLNVGGTAGYRYTQADIDALWDSMRPVQPIAKKRRKRVS